MSHGHNPGSLSDANVSRGVFDICQAPLPGVMAKLFFPLAISMTLSSSVGVVDMYVAGQIGPAAQAAVGLGDQVLFFVLVMGSGLATACSSFISRTVGAGDYNSCRTYMRASLLVAVLLGAVSAVLGTLCAKPMLAMLGCRSEVSALAVPYTAYNSFGNAPFVVLLCLSAIFRALGRPLLSVYLWFITAGLANCLSLLLFYSNFSKSTIHSLNSLAYGWDSGCFLGCLCGLFLLKNASARLLPDLGAEAKNFNTRLRSAITTLLKVAAPAVVTELSLVVSNFLMYRLLCLSPVEPQSIHYQAAWTIKLKLEETMALIPLMGLGMTTGVVVGQNLGAGLTQRAMRACRGAATCASWMMLILGGAVSLAAPSLASCFGTDPATRAATVSLLVPSIFLFPLTAYSTIICAGMEGAGQTRAPMLLNLCFQVGVRLVLSYIVVVHLSAGLAGISVALCVSQLLMAGGSAWVYRAKNRLVPIPGTPIIQGGHVPKDSAGKRYAAEAC